MRHPFYARIQSQTAANGYIRVASAATAEEAALHRARFVAYPVGAEAAEVRLERCRPRRDIGGVGTRTGRWDC